MAKTKRGNKPKETNINQHISLTEDQRQGLGLEGLPEPTTRPFVITWAKVKDLTLYYGYKITDGNGKGDIHAVHGAGIAFDSLIHSFGRLRVHLAVIDDAFGHLEVEMEDIDKFHADEVTDRYSVTGIEIKGADENECVKIIGTKYGNMAGARIEPKMPWIPIDSLSSYKWKNELKAAVDVIREEVALYKEGNCEIPEDKEEKPNPMQLSIGAEIQARELEAAEAKQTILPGYETTEDSEDLYLDIQSTEIPDTDFQDAKV